jgi:NADH:ubiquinone oxidoreductase subunit 5 (subunit L)/multisubunit Na+/H+ antiporter MnhA subunit
MFRTGTIFIARIAALLETDSKKIVALSTLSQLGLIVLGLYLGGTFICLFHLLMHALAKANLFIIVGNLIHFSFSQQDIRRIPAGITRKRIYIIVFVRIFSLRGGVLISGFFSKDLILLFQYSILTRALS